MLAKPCPCGGAGTLTLPVERAPTHCPLCRGMPLAESRAASRRTHRQLWGREKMKFEPLRQTKDLAGASREPNRNQGPGQHRNRGYTYGKRITRRVLLLAPRSNFFSNESAGLDLIPLFSHKVHSF